MQNHKYELTTLPYNHDSLSPVISKEIVQLHHDKHHAGYVAATNAALELLEKARAKEITINRKAVMRDLSFNLNGHLLHELYWLNMQPFQEKKYM